MTVIVTSNPRIICFSLIYFLVVHFDVFLSFLNYSLESNCLKMSKLSYHRIFAVNSKDLRHKLAYKNCIALLFRNSNETVMTQLWIILKCYNTCVVVVKSLCPLGNECSKIEEKKIN